MINIINFVSIAHAPYASNLIFPFMSENKTPINKRKTKKKGCYFFKNNTLTTTSVCFITFIESIVNVISYFNVNDHRSLYTQWVF